MAELALFDCPPQTTPAERRVLAYVDARQYGELPAELADPDCGRTVWVDGHGTWCYRGLPRGHREGLAALRERGAIKVGRRTRRVRFALTSVTVRIYERAGVRDV